MFPCPCHMIAQTSTCIDQTGILNLLYSPIDTFVSVVRSSSNKCCFRGQDFVTKCNVSKSLKSVTQFQ